MELEANKNFLLPRLDISGRYRWRGFGQDLFPGGPPGEFNNALADLTSGQFQEWQLGAELSFPIGFRKAYAAVRNSEMRLARERALLHEAERSVVFDLSNSFAEVERAYALVETNLNRRIAAAEQVAAIEATYESETDTATLYQLLEAQRRLAEAETAYFRSLVEHQLAVKNVQLEKGTLLDYSPVYLNEGTWPDKTYEDAEERELRRGLPYERDTPMTQGIPVSQECFRNWFRPTIPHLSISKAQPTCNRRNCHEISLRRQRTPPELLNCSTRSRSQLLTGRQKV